MLKLNMIDTLISRHKAKGLEQERIDILNESKDIEQSYLNDELSQEQYDAAKARLHDRLILVDLEKEFHKAKDKTDEFMKKQENMIVLNGARKRQLEPLLQKKSIAESDVKEARNLFQKNKFDAESFKKILKEKNTEIMELGGEVLQIYTLQAEDKAKEMEIMLSTQLELKLHEAEEMAGDIATQVPETGDSQLPVFEKRKIVKPKKVGKRENIEIPKHHNTEVNEPRRMRRRHRHVT